ncbi:hypothetical protein E3V08_05985 [Candidatus Atribacteria bacterium MT.SAG.1]|nr:hypothetical protein E3V08_05985 [Candidatus Atribacteria bacterium MT.SAG.1]
MLNQKGISLYLAIMVMSILSAVSLGLISMSISGIKIAKGLENSVMSFYAANTGIEHSLYNIRKQGGTGIVSDDLEQTSYNVSVSIDEEEVIIKSVGTYRNTKRAIEVKYQR